MTQFVKVPDGLTVEYAYDRPYEYVDGPLTFGADLGRPEVWMITTAIATRRKRVSSKGGTTTAYVKDQSGRVVGVGVAYCRPDEQFVKAIGRDLALERALLGCGAKSTYDRHVERIAHAEQARLMAADRAAEVNRARGQLNSKRFGLGLPPLPPTAIIDCAAPDR